MAIVWRENFRGKVDGFLARSLERMRSDIENLRAQLAKVAKQASEKISIDTIRRSLQAGGSAPLNVQGLLGRLAQPQTGGAPALDDFPATADPITQDGALFVLKGATNQLYRVNGAAEPETFEIVGGGAVSSVDATVPVEFEVSGVPITTTGTIAITKATEPANTVWAGPETGADAEPTFRALVADDIPSGITPDLHHTTHENSGSDEINVAGLSGVLADPQVPITENVQDIVGAMLIDNNDLDWDYNDGAGTETATLLGTASAINPAFVTLTDGATVTWALANIRVNNAKVTLGGNRALSITGTVNGSSGLLIVKQDGVGGRTLSLPAGSVVVGGGAGSIVLSTAASSADIISFYYDGTNYFWTYGKSFT